MNARLVVMGALAFIVLAVAGCADAGSDGDVLPVLRDTETVHASSRARVGVDVRAAEPVRLGKNTLVVAFPERPDIELTTAAALMPAHGHGSSPPSIAREGTGFVARDVVLYMSGRWEIRLGFKVDGREDEAVVGVDVP